MNQIKIIEQIRSREEEKAFRRLYQLFPKVERHIVTNSGSKEEALDIFQEALIILFRKINEGLNREIKIDGYLVNTCKLLWSNELRKKKVRKNSGEEPLEKIPYEDEISDHLVRESRFAQIEAVFEKIGQKCKEILTSFYHKRWKMSQIARAFGYKSEQSAKVKKYKCMEHARKLVLELNKEGGAS